MNRLLPLVTSVAVGVCALAISEDARALGPVDLEVGAKVGAASSPTSAAGAPNPLGFGVGGRAGVALFHGLYLGGNLMYYFGGSANEGGGTTLPSVSVSLNTLMYGGEVGYGLTILDLLTIRPQVGIGNATINANVGGFSTSSWYLEPGVTAFVGLGLLFVGADVNALFLPNLQDNQAAFSAHAQIGLKF